MKQWPCVNLQYNFSMLRPPGNATLATHRSASSPTISALQSMPSSHTQRPSQLHTHQKNARRVAIDPYWLVVQQDSWVAANALTDGGVDGRRSKWSVQKWPSRRTAARPIAAAADDATRRRPPQDVCRPRRRRTRWSGGCGPRDALGKSPLLERNFARFRLRFRQDLGRRSEDRRRQSVFETPGGLAKRSNARAQH